MVGVIHELKFILHGNCSLKGYSVLMKNSTAKSLSALESC